ncbi:hypothetical protein [Clostridium saccharobutylicum]|uniref:Uncharacterized protein n=1 Tax=Clostridium saccharobutylicum DSM 13864 TaxID=1345695 RepID=U5MXW1_CLOSA|nr:hypothetical protein [Clostridium saccharobutylicum]AGX44456.1 hypothetical protein CLSA_c34950 [Clostridium saccharobutylicum DSM 13864]AQR91750.1 hypothetical protein CLOSC_34780 [Clostridium saccharobutylicum]AQS01652.1 hypothetical protein CSACC_34830 [Clostridium saccharobutylicum]AQS11262.1 hypothetical protein CLOBY_34180 [Clostridium saccharobutylicum]AQS15635.1 hypothetical protein CLOSACC_34830 [Clostridium saccharobutylicum]
MKKEKSVILTNLCAALVGILNTISKFSNSRFTVGFFCMLMGSIIFTIISICMCIKFYKK